MLHIHIQRYCIVVVPLGTERTREPNDRLSLLFHMSRRSLERLMKSARGALIRDIVPTHLGCDNITRDQIAQ